MVVWQHLFGINSVLAALNAQKRIFQTLMIAEPITEKHTIVSKANELGINYKVVDRNEVEKWATGKNHQGVVLKASEIKPIGIKSIKEISDYGARVWICLDHVTDPQNFGSILRSAYFFGVNGILIPTRNTAPLSSTVSKVSSGSMEYLDIYETHDLASFVQEMKDDGWTIIGASSEKGSKELKSLQKRLKTLVVMGNEGEGISRKMKKICDEVYFIKGGNGTVDSLNVGCAAGIFLYNIYNN